MRRDRQIGSGNCKLQRRAGANASPPLAESRPAALKLHGNADGQRDGCTDAPPALRPGLTLLCHRSRHLLGLKAQTLSPTRSEAERRRRDRNPPGQHPGLEGRADAQRQ